MKNSETSYPKGEPSRDFEIAQTELLRLSALGALDRCKLDPAAFRLLVEESATSVSANCHGVLRELGRVLASIPEGEMLALWKRWLEVDSFYLHMLVPAILEESRAPSDGLTMHVLQAGIDYPDPSFNRYFVEAAIKHLGIVPVLTALLAKTETADDEALRSIAAAYYWTFPGPSGWSWVSSPVEPRSTEETILRSALSNRVGRVVKFFRRKPWWQFW